MDNQHTAKKNDQPRSLRMAGKKKKKDRGEKREEKITKQNIKLNVKESR